MKGAPKKDPEIKKIQKDYSCPYRQECLQTDKAVSMHHCPYCDAMVIAGHEPGQLCTRMEQIRNES